MTTFDDPDTAVVPRGLLSEVLDAAEGNLWAVHGEFCVSTDLDSDGRHCCDKGQEAIDALRLAAGLSDEPGAEGNPT